MSHLAHHPASDEKTHVRRVMDGQQPWWAKSVWTLGPVTVGFFLLFMVYVGWLPSPMMKAHIDLLESVRGLNDALNRTTLRLNGLESSTAQRQESMAVEIAKVTSEMLTLRTALNTGLRKICRNTAKNQQANEQCDAI